MMTHFKPVVVLIALLCLPSCNKINDLLGRETSPEVSPTLAADALALALASDTRAESDRARDATRKPVEVITFLGIGEGMVAVDLIAASGYYTEVLASAVGPKGMVYAQNPAFVLQFRDGANDKALTERLAGDRLANVVRLDREINDMGIPAESVDAVVTALNFHDVYNGNPDDALGMLQAVYAVLKPGGVMGIIDHRGNPGADNAKFHRVDEQAVIDTALAAGFTVEATSDVLANAADDHTLMVFDPSVRGNTDRLLVRLRKPE